MKTLSEKMNVIKGGEEQYNSYEMRIRKIKEELEKGSLMQKALAMEILKWTDHIEVHRDGTLVLKMDKAGDGNPAEFYPGKEGEESGGFYGIREIGRAHV